MGLWEIGRVTAWELKVGVSNRYHSTKQPTMGTQVFGNTIKVVLNLVYLHAYAWPVGQHWQLDGQIPNNSSECQNFELGSVSTCRNPQY